MLVVSKNASILLWLKMRFSCWKIKLCGVVSNHFLTLFPLMVYIYRQRFKNCTLVIVISKVWCDSLSMCYMGSIYEISGNYGQDRSILAKFIQASNKRKDKWAADWPWTSASVDLGQTNRSIYNDQSILVPKHLDDEKRKNCKWKRIRHTRSDRPVLLKLIDRILLWVDLHRASPKPLSNTFFFLLLDLFSKPRQYKIRL